MVKKTNKKRAPIIVFFVILITLILILGVSVYNMRAKAGNGTNINTTKVKTGSIEVVKDGSGTVQAKESKSVTVPYDSKVVTLKVENGDKVKKGDSIAVMESDGLENNITQLETEIADLDTKIKNADKSVNKNIISNVNGRIKAIFADEGTAVMDTMSKYEALLEIAADEKLKVVISSESDYKIGDKLTVKFSDYKETGTVAANKNGKLVVTIPDSGDYDIGETAVVTGNDGEKLGEGDLTCNQPYYVTGTNGIVDNIRYDLNDKVYEGSTLITLTGINYPDEYISLIEERNDKAVDLQELKEYSNSLVITAPSGGIVSGLSTANGTEVTAGTSFTTGAELCKVLKTDVYELKAEVDELDIDGIQVGQKADIEFDAFEDETIKGTVTKISNLGTNTNGVTTYTVTLEMEGSDRIKTNMSATAKIVTKSSENTLIVPVDAIQTIGEKKYVTVVTKTGEKQNTKQQEVTLGIVNSVNAEITYGLKAGDEVAVTTELSTAAMNSPFGRGGSNGSDNSNNSNDNSGNSNNVGDN